MSLLFAIQKKLAEDESCSVVHRTPDIENSIAVFKTLYAFPKRINHVSIISVFTSKFTV